MNPSIGRNVHYIVPAGPSAGKHLAAIIVSVDSAPADAAAAVLSNLRVFEDHKEDLRGHDRIRGVAQDPEAKIPGTWHEPERGPAPNDALTRLEIELSAEQREREFNGGAELALDGGQLPPNASEFMKQGYNEYKRATDPAPPGPTPEQMADRETGARLALEGKPLPDGANSWIALGWNSIEPADRGMHAEVVMSPVPPIPAASQEAPAAESPAP